MTQAVDDEANITDEELAGDESGDDDLESQIDWEEELESQYGGNSRRDQHRESKPIVGAGFAKQKELLEKNKGYGGSRKPKVSLVDKTKK